MAGRWALLVGLLWAGTVPARPDGLGSFFHHDVDVLTVTDVTEAGRALPTPSPGQPIYYMIVDVGLQSFGRSWAGERIPSHRRMLRAMMQAMALQGYRLADEQHPPTQLFVFGWGMLRGGPDRQALHFLGGEKVDLMWEQQQYGGFLSPRVLLRGLERMGVAGKVWDFAESDLFLGVVRSYTMESLHGDRAELLWETRFGCPATGLALDEALPLMIKAAAPSLGRDTPKPVNVNATDVFGGRVDLGELQVIGTERPEIIDQTEKK